MRQAFSLMSSGQPGPVNVDVPLNVFVEKTDTEIPDPSDWRLGVSKHLSTHEADIEQVLAELSQSSRPLILVGHGLELAEAEKELAEIAELFQIPVACTPLGKGCFDPRSELNVGETGRNGTLVANSAARNADLIIALGTRFDDRATSSWLAGYTFEIPPTRLIQVDIDPTELGHNYPVHLGIVANIKDFLSQLYVTCTNQKLTVNHTQDISPYSE